METPEIKTGLCFNRELGGFTAEDVFGQILNTSIKRSNLRLMCDIIKYDNDDGDDDALMSPKTVESSLSLLH